MGEWDYIIVGAGSAGCVLANRLSARGEHVLLLEAGGSDSYPWVHVPIGYLYCIDNPRTDWRFRTVEEPGLGGRSLLYPRGKLLGGCSSINGMLYLRGQAADYDQWRQSGLPGWSWDDVLPYFLKSEDNVEGASNQHGTGGEWHVDRQLLHWDILDRWMEAAEATGLPRTTDFNTGDNEGVGYFRVNQKNGLRWNTAKAFLKPVKSRGNLRIEIHSPTEKVFFDGSRATSVHYRQNGDLKTATARGEIILAAGAVGSPHILQLSDIGPAEHLLKYGIEAVSDMPSVGGNLQDHLQIRCSYQITGARTLNTMSATLAGKARIALEYALKRSGPDVGTPDLEYHVQPLSLDAFGEDLHPFDAITASVCHLRPDSRGHVRLTFPDPNTQPEIRPNYLSAPRDRIVAARAIRLTRRIMAQAPLAPFQPEEFRPDTSTDDDEELAIAAGTIGTTIFHPVGTVRMGKDEAAPLDERLRLRGVERLRVVDASIMPTITSGNTNAPVIMIAEKASDMILEDAKG